MKRLAAALAVLLAATLAAMPSAQAGNFRAFYGPNGNYVGSSSTSGGGRFTNFYDRNGQYVGSSVRQGIGKRR